ncbi:MAG: hypothetical protein ACJA0Z_000252 [Halioglobus sp.]
MQIDIKHLHDVESVHQTPMTGNNAAPKTVLLPHKICLLRPPAQLLQSPNCLQALAECLANAKELFHQEQRTGFCNVGSYQTHTTPLYKLIYTWQRKY